MKHHFALVAFTAFLLGGTICLYGAAAPKVSQTLKLASGWNAVSLEGTPLFQAEFLKLHPFVYDEVAKGYVRCDDATVLQRGTAVWIYCAAVPETPVVVALAAASTETAEAMPAQDGWAFLGAASDQPAWKGGASRFFQWDCTGGFRLTSVSEADVGYWVNYTAK